jgi:hypothetical protein
MVDIPPSQASVDGLSLLWFSLRRIVHRDRRALYNFRAEDRVVLFNTGSAYKYLDVLEGRRRTQAEPPASGNFGGIIGPY